MKHSSQTREVDGASAFPVLLLCVCVERSLI